MSGEITKGTGGALFSAVERKNSFLTRFNRIPYNRHTDPRDLNSEIAEMAFMYPNFYQIFDNWPSWELEDVSEVITILAGDGFTYWEIKDVLDAYRCRPWENLTESDKDDRIREAIDIAKKRLERNRYGVPSEFDGLYKLNFGREGNVTKIEFFYSDIAERIKANLGVISFNGQVYVYGNGVYRESVELVKKEIARIVKGIQTAKKGSGISIKTADQEIMYYIKYDNPYLEWPFNKYTDMIPVNNGIVKIDIESEVIQLIPHNRNYKFTYKLPVNYNSDADSKPINDILQQYVDSPEVLKQIPAQALLQMLGYGPFKKCYLLHGKPDAGKSSYLEVLYRTFGYDNKSDIPLHELAPEKSRFKLAGLIGKLFNIHDDLSDIPMKDAGTIKNLTGAYSHDVEIKNVQPFRADIRAVHVFSCNKPPQYDSELKDDEAFWSRWEVVHFLNQFENDPDFYNRVFTHENLSGFFNEILTMAIWISREKELPCSSDSINVQVAWTKCTDPVYTFITTHMRRSKSGMVIYYGKEDFVNLLNEWGKNKNFTWDNIPLTVMEASHSLKICAGVKVTKAPADEKGYRAPAYKFPYEWVENSIWKDKIQPITVITEQPKLE